MSLPALSQTSVERMGCVVDQADDAVDNGTPPAEAIAKAAQDHALPIGHVPIVVRSFNTGRSVRQLSAPDPWTKAADYPSTTAEAVCAILGKPSTEVKLAGDADYLTAPGYVTKQASSPPFEMSEWTKAAVARLNQHRIVTKPVECAGNIRSKVAALLDQLRDDLCGLSPETYAGVKRASVALCKESGVETLAFLESQNTVLSYKATKAASAVPDVTVTTRHGVVSLVKQICDARATYDEVDKVPLGYTKLAWAEGWLQQNPKMDVIDLEQVAVVKQSTDKSVTIVGPEVIKASAGAAPPSPGGSTAFGRGLSLWGAAPALANNALTSPVTDLKISDPSAKAVSSVVHKTHHDLDNIGAQADLQNIVSDPRLVNSDPKTVIQTYQELSQLAPHVMRNPAIASDFIHRRTQTGPLSSFDLKTLLEMEKTYVASRNSVRKPIEDDMD